MITISTCMIVKNEERVLARCLDCVKSFSDEIIIVDTGSTDRTKEIAAAYTDKIYDFEWCNDFAAARDYSFSKASMDYIYIADADEIIDADNQRQILDLKKVLLPEIEIVQMYYTNQLEYGSTYNYDKEYRPKLARRLREFHWQDPLHETLRTAPIIYDSDIAIIHKPHESHCERDFANLQKLIHDGVKLSTCLTIMYAKELFISGKDKDFLDAEDYFLEISRTTLPEVLLAPIQCVLAKCAAIRHDAHRLLAPALKNFSGEVNSEVCTCLGQYYEEAKDYDEAILWYYNAAYETSSTLSLAYDFELPLHGLIRCYDALGNTEMCELYQKELSD